MTGCRECMRYSPVLAGVSVVVVVVTLAVTLLKGLSGANALGAMLAGSSGEPSGVATTISISATFSSAAVVAAVIATISSAVSRATARLAQEQALGCSASVSKEGVYRAWTWATSTFAALQLLLILWTCFILGVILLWYHAAVQLSASSRRISLLYASTREGLMVGLDTVGISPDTATQQLDNQLDASWTANLAATAKAAGLQGYRDGMRRVVSSFGVPISLLSGVMNTIPVEACPTTVCIDTTPWRDLLGWDDGVSTCVCDPSIIAAWETLSSSASFSLCVALISGMALVGGLVALTMSVYADSKAFQMFHDAVYLGTYDRFAYDRVKWSADSAEPTLVGPVSKNMWRRLESGGLAPPP